MSAVRASEYLGQMNTERAADVMNMLSKEKVANLMNNMNPKQASLLITPLPLLVLTLGINRLPSSDWFSLRLVRTASPPPIGSRAGYIPPPLLRLVLTLDVYPALAWHRWSTGQCPTLQTLLGSPGEPPKLATDATGLSAALGSGVSTLRRAPHGRLIGPS
eukprot:430282-Prorocentrum_minimum.AAC.3